MPWEPKQTVVVPIDFSDSTQLALETAKECAEASENIHVLHVVWAIDSAPQFGTWNADDLAVRQANASSKINELLKENDMLGAEIAILAGDPGQRIVEYTEQVNADLVVIPSHGYSGLRRLMLGSTAERVIRHTSCPAYVLRRHDAK